MNGNPDLTRQQSTAGPDDHELATSLASRRRGTAAGRPRRAHGRRRRRTHREGRRGPARPRLLMAQLAVRPPRRRRAVRGGQGRPGPPRRLARVDHRPARRHPGVRRGAASDWAVHVALAIDGAPVAGAVALPGPGRHARHRAGRRRAPTATRTPPSASWSAAPARRPLAPGRGRGPRRRAASRWARPGPRPWRSCGARPTSTCTPAGSTSGTTAPRSRWPSPPACTPSRLDGSPLVYNNDDVYLPDLVICRPELADDVLAAVAAVDHP